MSVLIKNPTTVVGKGAVIEQIDIESLKKIQPSRYIDIVYLNKGLNDERMMELLSQINYVDYGGGLFLNLVFCPIELTNQEKIIAIAKMQVEDFLLGHMIVLLQGEGITPLWFSQQLYDFTHQEGVGDELGTPFGTIKVEKAGWTNFTDYLFGQNFTDYIHIGAFCTGSLDQMPVGADNELLKLVFSTTPFIYYKKELKGVFNGDTLQANVGGEYFDGKTVDVEKLLDSKKLPLNIDVEYAKIKVDDTEVDLIGEYDGTTISVNENVDMQSLINQGKIPLSIEVPSGGIAINGLIKEYQVFAGENINAGDFVEYTNNFYKTLNSNSSSSYYGPTCVLLEQNKVFIAHSYSSSRNLYGTIVEINGLEMTATTTQLNSKSYSNYNVCDVVLLEQNKVFIAHIYGSSQYLYGTIVEINGLEMTATTTQLNSEQNSAYYYLGCCLLEQNKVFIAHTYNYPSYYLYGTIVEINGTTMTPTTTQLNSNSNYCESRPSCVLLEQNKVFIAHSRSNSSYLCGTIVEINGTTMTPTTTQLNSNSRSGYYIDCCLLEQNKVFIAHLNTSLVLYGTIVEINGTTMTPTTTQLASGSYRHIPCCFLLEQYKVLIVCGGPTIYKIIVEINGTTMTPTVEALVNSNVQDNPTCVLLEQNKVFIAHSYSSSKYLGGTIYVGDRVKPYETTIFGVAKTVGVGGDTIQVYVPNEE